MHAARQLFNLYTQATKLAETSVLSTAGFVDTIAHSLRAHLISARAPRTIMPKQLTTGTGSCMINRT